MSNKGFWALLIVLLAALAALVAWFWQQSGDQLIAPPPTTTLPPVTSAPYDAVGEPPTVAAAASKPEVQFPVEPAASDAQVAASAEFDLGKAVTGLVGSKAGSEFLQLAEFPRRFVATVDNLGRGHAPPSSWPVNRTPGRFTTTEAPDGKTFIAADNRARYEPLVSLLTSIDTRAGIDLYVRIYPMLQQAYEGIGYPNRHFNDRFVEVIDLLLATPEPKGPLQVRLVEVKGPVPSTRPWVRYEFADPQLEQLAAGQKILLRLGDDQRRRLKQELVELRGALTSLARPR